MQPLDGHHRRHPGARDRRRRSPPASSPTSAPASSRSSGPASATSPAATTRACAAWPRTSSGPTARRKASRSTSSTRTRSRGPAAPGPGAGRRRGAEPGPRRGRPARPRLRGAGGAEARRSSSATSPATATDGPYRDKKAYDLLIQSEAGFLSVTGTRTSRRKAGPSIADIAAGMYAYTNILAALLQRGSRPAGASTSTSRCWSRWASGCAIRSTTPSTAPRRRRAPAPATPRSTRTARSRPATAGP